MHKSGKKSLMIIADPGIDRNFRNAGKKGLPGKTLREFPTQRTYSQGQFLQMVKGSIRPSFSLWSHQRLLWRKRPKEHGHRYLLQTVPYGLSGK